MTCYFFCSLPQVKNVFEQEGFSRQKRGYRNINDIEVNMSDPLFTKQWYLVSNQPRGCLTFKTMPHSSPLIKQRPGIFPTPPRISFVIHSLISSASTVHAISSVYSHRPSCFSNWQPWLLWGSKLTVIYQPCHIPDIYFPVFSPSPSQASPSYTHTRILHVDWLSIGGSPGCHESRMLSISSEWLDKYRPSRWNPWAGS